MKIRFSLLGAMLVLVSGILYAQSAATDVSGSATDIEAIATIERQWEIAWNRHDVSRMVRLFAPDANVVNLAGEWFKNREAFAKSLEELHSAKTEKSIWRTEQIHTSFLAPDIAIVHVYFNSSGERKPDGSPLPPRRGIFTRVEAKRNGRWLIVASQATKIVPPETADEIGNWPTGDPDLPIAQLRP